MQLNIKTSGDIQKWPDGGCDVWHLGLQKKLGKKVIFCVHESFISNTHTSCPVAGPLTKYLA